MGNEDDLSRRALERIEHCNDPKDLRRVANNALDSGDDVVRQAALRKLYFVSPDAAPGTLEHAVWQSIYSLEDSLKSEDRSAVADSTENSAGWRGEHGF